MAPSRELNQLVKGLIVYMGQFHQQSSTQCDKKIAKSSEFQNFVLRLSETAPSAMQELLNLASRKCEEALGVEKDAQAAKKRAATSDGNDRSAKRVQITCPGKETAPVQRVAESKSKAQGFTVQRKLQTAQRGVLDDVIEKSEVLSLRSGSQCPETAYPDTSASETKAKSNSEDLEEGDLDVKPKDNNLSNVSTSSISESEDDGTVSKRTKHDVEFRLTTGEATIQDKVTAILLTIKPSGTRPHCSVRDEVAKVLQMLTLLEARMVKSELVEYLENRAKMPGDKLQIRTQWNISEPNKILDELHTVKRNTMDNKIHRVYGQTMLFSSVNALVAKGYKATVTGRMWDHTAILEELARKKAGCVSKKEVEQTISSYLFEYYAGQKWSAVINWFRGSGIALLFVTAGIGSHYVEKQWTEFQRQCLQYIAGLLPSIRGLVEALGPEALGLYCQDGCLDKSCIDRVKLAKMTQSDGDEGSEEGASEDDAD